jgi:hypothetical protein
MSLFHSEKMPSCNFSTLKKTGFELVGAIYFMHHHTKAIPSAPYTHFKILSPQHRRTSQNQSTLCCLQ